MNDSNEVEPARSTPTEDETYASRSEHFEEGEEAAPPYVRVMALLRWALVIAMAIAATASLLHVLGDAGAQETAAASQYYCPMHPSVVQDHPGDCPICNMTLVLKEPSVSKVNPTPSPTMVPTSQPDVLAGQYYCPMHPSAVQDQAGDCPICNMHLVLKEPPTSVAKGRDVGEFELHSPATHAARERYPVAPSPSAPQPQLGPLPGVLEIELTQDRIQLIGMRTAKVRRAGLQSELRSLGYVVPTETGLVSIQLRFTGWIQELHLTQTGQPVARGQLLARVYSPELLSVQQELLNAKNWAATKPSAPETVSSVGGSPLLESARSRLALMGMVPAEIAEVERSGEAHRLVEVRSPARGVVTQKNALQGLYVQPGTELFQIADLSKVWVIVEVAERDAAGIHVGQSASLLLAAYPDESFVGRVQFIAPSLDTNTRTMRARVELKNPGLRLRPGMYGDVTLKRPAAEGLLIPREAIVDTGDHQYVFVMKQAGRFEPRAIRIGARSDADVQILAGLSEGEVVVTTGNFLVDSESRLRSAIEGTSTAAPQAVPEHRH